MKAQPKNPFQATQNTTMKSSLTNRFRPARAGTLASLILLPMALPVSAADSIWNSATVSPFNWATAGNWSAGVPGTTEKASFNGAAAQTARISVGTTI